jgi:hypothetical protein
MNGTFGSTILDLAIGLAFIYLILALVCTTVTEWISGILNTRSRLLEKGIRQLLDAQPAANNDSTGTFLSKFYSHPVITGMMKGERHPSYVAARNFSATIMDLVTPAKLGTISFTDLEQGIKDLPDGDVRKALLALIQNAGGSLATAQKNIEGWFNDAMDRVSGWYKRNTQIWTVVIAVVVAVGVNADTLNMVHRLWTNPELRNAVVAEAKVQASKPLPPYVEYPNKDKPFAPKVNPSAGGDISDRDRQLLGELIGWGDGAGHPQTNQAVDAQRVIGWLLTAIALSLGAPFWFDTLNRFMNIRSAGKSPDETSKTPEKGKLPPANQTA